MLVRSTRLMHLRSIEYMLEGEVSSVIFGPAIQGHRHS